MKKRTIIITALCVALATLCGCTHTEDLPSVSTSEVTDITQTTALAGGSILANGANVTVRGVCYSSTNSNPTIEGLHTTDGSGTGDFNSPLSSLLENTTYYVRAYAMNNSGVSYGNVVTFSTTGSFTSPFEGIYHGTYEYQNNNTTAVGDIEFTSVPSDSSVIVMFGGIQLTKVGDCSFQNIILSVEQFDFFNDVLSNIYNPTTEQIKVIGVSTTFEGNKVTVLMNFEIVLLSSLDTRLSVVRFSGNKM